MDLVCMLLCVYVCAHCATFSVPSANKKDLRSIEETLQDIRSKKRARIAEQTLELTPANAVPALDSPAGDKKLRLDESEGMKVTAADT